MKATRRIQHSRSTSHNTLIAMPMCPDCGTFYDPTNETQPCCGACGYWPSGYGYNNPTDYSTTGQDNIPPYAADLSDRTDSGRPHGDGSGSNTPENHPENTQDPDAQDPDAQDSPPPPFDPADPDSYYEWKYGADVRDPNAPDTDAEDADAASSTEDDTHDVDDDLPF